MLRYSSGSGTVGEHSAGNKVKVFFVKVQMHKGFTVNTIVHSVHICITD